MKRNSFSGYIGNVPIGGNSPIVIQSMTDTDTADIDSTVQQIIKLYDAGSELVRISVDRKESAVAVPYIREHLDKLDIFVPLIGDFHYIGHKLLSENQDCAIALSKYRINPGNVGFYKKRDKNFSKIIELAILYNKSIRIGVNWGSLDKELLNFLLIKNSKKKEPLSKKKILHEAIVQSALNSAKLAEKIGLSSNKIIISAKSSQVQDLIAIYNMLANRCGYALHLGLTEAGMEPKGIIASSVAIGILLQQGIGDTIRISLTPKPGNNRDREVYVAKELLQVMELRYFMPSITSCPGCGRTTSHFFQDLAKKIQNNIQENMHIWKHRYPGIENLKIAVMGCVVNGPGESKHVDIGISLPGIGENPIAPVFIDGKKNTILKGKNISENFLKIIVDYVEKRFSPK